MNLQLFGGINSLTLVEENQEKSVNQHFEDSKNQLITSSLWIFKLIFLKFFVVLYFNSFHLFFKLGY